ncbi:MAG: phage tail protein [Bacteroidia bacterium]
MFVDPYIATITIFAGNFAPSSWRYCNGQLLSIAEYTALFSLIGTTYGGDGQVTFALPDFRGRVGVHQGQGPGLSNYTIGEMAGTENVTLLSSNLPTHTHTVVSLPIQQPASTVNNSGVNEPKNAYPASGATLYESSSDGTRMGAYTSATVTTIAGSNSPVSIIQPYLAMNYIIAVEGIFPSRA